jgi:hypothetical protein
MKAIQSLVMVALATAGLAAALDAQAQRSPRGGGGNHVWSGSRASTGHWNGGGNWRGGGSHWRGGGGHWRGGWGWGLAIGVPLLWSPWYWGYPYGYGYYYPRTVVVDQVIERYPASYPEGYMEPAPSTEVVPRGEGAPTQAPTYMNYCESAKAYFPKVTSCPEGWKFISPR